MLRSTIFTILFWLTVLPVLAQPTSKRNEALARFRQEAARTANRKPVRKSIRDFGALGNGIQNDSWAFMRASRYIASLQSTNTPFELFIPKGIYLVGLQSRRGEVLKNGELRVQAPSYEAYYAPILLDLTGVSNVKIYGEPGTVIKYRDGIKYGAFDAATEQKYQPDKMPFTNSYYAAAGGVFLLIHHSRNVEISNLELDGNLPGLNIGGNFGDLGIQLGHIGVYLSSQSENILLSKIHAHHFGLDGFHVRDRDTLDNSLKIMDYCRAEFNGRQGCSWTGGNNLYCFNSVFANTGQSRVSSAPGAGLDIEPESGGSSCTNGYFEQCAFYNNKQYALLATSTAKDRISRGHQFVKCAFIGNQSPALKSPGSPARFISCHFIGALVSPSGSLTEPLEFVACNFTDQSDQLPQTYSKLAIPWKRPTLALTPPYCLIDLSWGKGSTLFQDCEFYFSQSVALMLDGGNSCILKNSILHFNYLKKFLDERSNIAFIHDCKLESNVWINQSTGPVKINSNGRTQSDGRNTLKGNSADLLWNGNKVKLNF